MGKASRGTITICAECMRDYWLLESDDERYKRYFVTDDDRKEWANAMEKSWQERDNDVKAVSFLKFGVLCGAEADKPIDGAVDAHRRYAIILGIAPL